jgi:uroporphyrinogen-III decarboxylase
MITGMDRLVAAINGETTDRIPVFCNLLDQGAKELGIKTLQEYYSKGEYVATAQLKMREKYGYDNLWSLFYVGKEAELLGCQKIIYATDGPPNVEHFVIGSYADIEKLQIPDDITNHPRFAEELQCLQLLSREAKGKYPICAYLTASMTLPALLMGMDKWFDLLFFGPAAVRDELLAKCSDFFHKEVTAYRNAGADVILYANPFGSTDFIPLKRFHALSMPWMKKDLEAIGTADVVYYCGSSRMNNVIAPVLEQLDIKTFYLSPNDDVAAGKSQVAGRGLTWGVINDILLIDWTEDEVRNEVKRIITAGMTGGKFGFGTLVMPYKIPERNIRAMLAAAYEYGRY